MIEKIKQYKNLIKVLAGIIFLLTVYINIHVIPAGYTGVHERLGQIDKQPAAVGQILITVPFMEHIYLVNNKQQEYETYREHTGETRDNVGVKVKEVLITYQIAAERSVWICENVSDYDDRIMTDEEISSALKNAISELTAEDVKNRAKLEPRVLMKISESLACKYGADTVKVCQVLIGIVEMEEGYTEALRLKSQALQEQARVEIEN